ncbi:hypothetical protein ACT453_57080, partial [Bacillus sp. D-CC]
NFSINGANTLITIANTGVYLISYQANGDTVPAGSFGDAMAIRLQLNGVNIPNSEAYGTSAPGVTASNPATNTMLIVVTVT